VSQADGANTLRPQETNTRLGSRIHSIIILGEREERWDGFREEKAALSGQIMNSAAGHERVQ
jgi:hypothetical protein